MTRPCDAERRQSSARSSSASSFSLLKGVQSESRRHRRLLVPADVGPAAFVATAYCMGHGYSERQAGLTWHCRSRSGCLALWHDDPCGGSPEVL
jgi:hypothetical protein